MLCALHTFYPWSLDLFIHISFQLPFLEHVLIFTKWGMSQMKHVRVKCLAQGHNIVQNLHSPRTAYTFYLLVKITQIRLIWDQIVEKQWFYAY